MGETTIRDRDRDRDRVRVRRPYLRWGRLLLDIVLVIGLICAGPLGIGP